MGKTSRRLERPTLLDIRPHKLPNITTTWRRDPVLVIPTPQLKMLCWSKVFEEQMSSQPMFLARPVVLRELKILSTLI